MTEEEKEIIDLLNSDDPYLSPCPDCRLLEYYKLWTYFGMSSEVGKPLKDKNLSTKKYPAYCARHSI